MAKKKKKVHDEDSAFTALIETIESLEEDTRCDALSYVNKRINEVLMLAHEVDIEITDHNRIRRLTVQFIEDLALPGTKRG